MADDIPAPRYDIELSVRLIPSDPEKTFRGVSQNLSETGVLVRAERSEPLRTMLRVEFPVFAASGEVIWTRETGEDLGVFLGMKFQALSSEDKRMLLRLLRGPGTGASWKTANPAG